MTWELPSVEVLDVVPDDVRAVQVVPEDVELALEQHGVNVVGVTTRIGPQAISYAVEVAAGTLPAKVERAVPGVELALGAPVRYAGQHGGALVLEVARAERAGVTMRAALPPAPEHTGYALPIPVGVDLSGSAIDTDLAKMPHLIVAGTTGSGKSTYLHAVVVSLLMHLSPEDVHLHLVDPKHVELTSYERAPHVRDVATDAEAAFALLGRMTDLMQARYALLRRHGVQDVDGYNALPGVDMLTRHVVVVEELADLLMAAKLGSTIGMRLERLAQLGRASGIHLVVALQRPSAKVLPELLRANVPARAVFAVATPADGQVALGRPGATALTGAGDGLFVVPGVSEPVRFQSPYVSSVERERVVTWWSRQVVAEAPVVTPEPPGEPTPQGVELRRSLDLDAAARVQATRDAAAAAGVEVVATSAHHVLEQVGFTDVVLDALCEVLAERITESVIEGIVEQIGRNS